jgi:hypothetical protein
MRFRAFGLKEPMPKLNHAHALAVVRPWMDVGSAGSLTLSCLENIVGAKELARLARPGNFFDLTRYRPMLKRADNETEIDISNTVVSYGRQEGAHDFLFLRLLEPHMMAETYVDSMVELLKACGVVTYGLLGSMYDMVPYTRPLLVTGAGSNLRLHNELSVAKVISSDYQGPTTVLSLIGQRALESGIETFSMVVHLPGYFVLEEDNRGERRLMEVISSLYGFSMPQADTEKAHQQEEQLNAVAEQIMQREPRLRLILKQLEANYDSRVDQTKEETRLSPEVEKFLQGLDKRFRQG